jgi:hypothetical protein
MTKGLFSSVHVLVDAVRRGTVSPREADSVAAVEGWDLAAAQSTSTVLSSVRRGFTCRACGGHRDATVSGHCDDCES